MILSRNAEDLYWMGRYIERTEHLCRLLSSQVETLVDRPVQVIDFGWRRIYGSLNRRPPGPEIAFAASDDDDYTLADSFTLADDLTFEPANPDSIRNGLACGRENARQVRHRISGEMWTCLNAAWLRFSARTIDDIWKTTPETFYAGVARDLDAFSGVAQTTMYRDEGWRFLQLGRFTERAQLMIALLLAQLALVRDGQEGAAGGDWSGLLRTCQALDAYARCHGAEASADRVLDLLVADVLLPRSLCRALEMASRALDAASLGPGPTAEARQMAQDMAQAARGRWSTRPSLDDRAERLWRLQQECRALHDLVFAAYVGYRVDGAPAR